MVDKARIQALTQFAAALRDRPLDPADPDEAKLYVRALHVETDAQGHEKDPIAKLARKIERAEGGQHVWLFTGNIGSGKSTELRRLRGLLEDKKHIPILADASDYINLHQEIQISDFLISVSAAFAVEAGKRLGEAGIEAGYWERLRNLLTNTQITVTETSAKAALPGLTEVDIKAAIRLDPTFKQRLQQHLQAHLSTLRAEVEIQMAEIVQKLHARYGRDAKIVLLFDSLERLRGSGEAADKVFTSLRQMFTQFHDMLKLPGIQVVYSIPLYLVRLEPQLYALFGDAAFCSLTSAHIFLNRSRELDEDGLKVIHDIVTARYPNWRDYLPETQLDRLVEASGGDLRDLFRFLSGVLLELEDSEDAEAAVDYVLGQAARILTWITEPNLNRLRTISQTKRIPRGSQEDMDALVRDMETKRVLMYLNGDEWYDIHPLLRAYVDSDSAAG